MFEFMLSEEEIDIVHEAIDFVSGLPKQLMRDMDEDKIEYPREYVAEAGRRNLLGLRFPKEYGGRGMGWSCEVAALEEVGVLGMALGCAYSMPSIVGEALTKFGTEDQKQKYLVPMLKGQKISAEALTEPRGGSDFFGATTTAEKKGDKYILNGQKRFIVGAKGADFFVVYVRTNLDPEAPGHEAISLILVDRDLGVEVQDVYGLMGTRGGGTGRLVFHDVEVPAENLVGPENSGAHIFNSMMVPERMTSAGGAVGASRAAIDVAARYADRRHAFGAKIRKFQGVSFRIADSVARTDAARALVYAAARRLDAGLEAGGKDPACVAEAARSRTSASATSPAPRASPCGPAPDGIACASPAPRSRRPEHAACVRRRERDSAAPLESPRDGERAPQRSRAPAASAASPTAATKTPAARAPRNPLATGPRKTAASTPRR